MTRLTRKEVKFDWDNRCEEAFQELKRRLTSAPILIVPDRGQGYTAYCDASRAGCVLMQSGRVVYPRDNPSTWSTSIHSIG